MSEQFNIYCDESCHLENDHQKAMTLGAIWCPREKSRPISHRLRELKSRHQLPPSFELKWTRVSPSKLSYFLDVLDYFFDESDLHFRALIVPNKQLLNHAAFPGQDHDTWYYKMYFDLLKVLLSPSGKYAIYLDYKDTQGAEKVRKLHEVLCNNLYDYSREIVERVQLVRSHEIEQLQLADLLIGIISYVNRDLHSSSAKLELVGRMRQRSGYALDKSTLLRENKVNLFRWNAQEGEA